MGVQGKRRARIWSALSGCVLVAACSSPMGGAETSSDADLRLPTVVNAPGAWSEEEGVSGPVAAVGLAFRSHPVGLTGENGSLELFTVSAADGRSTWLRPTDAKGRDIELPVGHAVSPDGRWLAWAAAEGVKGRTNGWISGWTVMDTTSGVVRELRDPETSRYLALDEDLQFAGDSRYLLTSYEVSQGPGRTKRTGAQLVAWDVEDGTPSLVAEPGADEHLSLGSAPTDVVWSVGREVHRLDPTTGERTSITLPEEVGLASWGPDDESFAYVRTGSSHTVHVGRTVDEAEKREIDLPDDNPGPQWLSWQDPTHLVVASWRSWVDVVDIETGDVERVDLTGQGHQLNSPYLATDLWQRPLRVPAEPVGTEDPRVERLSWAAVLAVLAAAGVLLVRRRRSPDPSPA